MKVRGPRRPRAAPPGEEAGDADKRVGVRARGCACARASAGVREGVDVDVHDVKTGTGMTGRVGGKETCCQ